MSADGATQHGRESKSTEYEVASRLTHLRLELALATQALRGSAGLTGARPSAGSLIPQNVTF